MSVQAKVLDRGGGAAGAWPPANAHHCTAGPGPPHLRSGCVIFAGARATPSAISRLFDSRRVSYLFRSSRRTPVSPQVKSVCGFECFACIMELACSPCQCSAHADKLTFASSSSLVGAAGLIMSRVVGRRSHCGCQKCANPAAEAGGDPASRRQTQGPSSLLHRPC